MQVSGSKNGNTSVRQNNFFELIGRINLIEISVLGSFQNLLLEFEFIWYKFYYSVSWVEQGWPGIVFAIDVKVEAIQVITFGFGRKWLELVAA